MSPTLTDHEHLKITLDTIDHEGETLHTRAFKFHETPDAKHAQPLRQQICYLRVLTDELIQTLDELDNHARTKMREG